MPNYGFDNDELAKLFADAGAAVNKAKVASSKPLEISNEPMEESKPAADLLSDADKLFAAAAPAEKKAAPVTGAPSGKTMQIMSGTLEDDSLLVNIMDGASVKVLFSSIKSLALGRVDAEQIIAWVYSGSLYFVSDKSINLKGMVPKMAFSAPENWRAFLVLMTEKTSLNSEKGIQAVLTGGLIPKYNTRDDFFTYLRTL